MIGEISVEDDGLSRLGSISLPFPLLKSGKVREVFELPDGRLLMVATDRVSAFDWVLTPPIPGKGVVLTRISCFWFDRFADVPNHLLSRTVEDVKGLDGYRHVLEGRTLVVARARVFPFEFIVRGYLAGSAWEQYRRSGRAYGVELPKGLELGARLPEPLLTLTTKAESGHDEPVSEARVRDALGGSVADEIFERSLEIYRDAHEEALSRGLILADTKFEWGEIDGRPTLVDELLTPDSSRYWDAEAYADGRIEQFDKQVVRDWLISTGWGRDCTPPPLPAEVVERTRRRYRELLGRLSGQGR